MASNSAPPEPPKPPETLERREARAAKPPRKPPERQNTIERRERRLRNAAEQRALEPVPDKPKSTETLLESIARVRRERELQAWRDVQRAYEATIGTKHNPRPRRPHRALYVQPDSKSGLIFPRPWARKPPLFGGLKFKRDKARYKGACSHDELNRRIERYWRNEHNEQERNRAYQKQRAAEEKRRLALKLESMGLEKDERGRIRPKRG